MLLVAFEKPDPPAVPRPQAKPSPSFVQLPEAAWISNTVLYRGSHTLSEAFISSAEKYFGMTFVSSGASQPSPSSSNDVLINSITDLRPAWKGNTFSLSKAFTGEFETACEIDRFCS